MPIGSTEALVREVSLTEARNLSPLFDEAVRREIPVVIVRGGRERGLLLSRSAVLRFLAAYSFHVDVLPEPDGGFTLSLRELNIAATGPTLRAAREQLKATVRSYVRDYFREFDFYRHLPELAAQEPYVVRLSLAQDDEELNRMIFGVAAPTEGETDKAAAR